MNTLDRIGGRFLVEAEVASGGMGRVLRGRDTETDQRVAIKLTIRPDPASAARFDRECRALAEIGHPGIVRYVSHGVLPDGAPYLVMQWLEGRDLAHLLRDLRDPETVVASTRKRRGARTLSLRDVAVLGLRVASALGALHRAGIVHRDVKPSNIFLPDGTVDNAKLVDLGTVRAQSGPRDITQTGAVIGTPYYMAPEQARGDADVGTAADVFALGCVLYECLTGNSPFYASHFVAVLGRILLETPDPLISLRPDTPPALAALVDALLVKDAARRPADGDAVAAMLVPIRDALAAVEAESGEGRPPTPLMETPSAHGSSVGSDERRLSCFLWIRAAKSLDPELLGNHGAAFTELGAGATLIGMPSTLGASEQAVRTARLALALRAAHPEAAISIATGQVDTPAGKAPTGSDVARRAQSALDETPAGTIVLDSVTAALIAGNFTVSRTPEGLSLVSGEQDSGAHVRATGGKLFGRKKEMSLLTATLDEAIEDSVARAIVVTAPAGLGKTRLRQEIERLLEERDDVARTFVAPAEVAGSGSTYAWIGAALRRAARLRTGQDAGKSTERIAELVGRVAPEGRSRAAAFVRELCGLPTLAEDEDVLRAARGDPALYGSQLRAAWEDLLRAESQRGAVVLLLDNLHWADAPSVRLVLGALERLPERPIFVVALGRVESRAAHPDVFTRRGVAELALEPLSARAARQMVEESLGPDASESTIGAIVERSSGNPFYLEELVHAARTGTGERLPESILGMAQARLSALTPEARRVLRAASVLGEVVWTGAVELMLGQSGMTFATAEWLDDLVRKELLVARTSSRFPGERELAFRHSIVREAAYAMLTPEDRARAHRAAATWLEEKGEPDPLVIAMHLREGGDTDAAALALRLAAERAMERNDPQAALARAREAIEAGASGQTRGACLAIVAAIAASAGEHDTGIETGLEASLLSPRGSKPFFAGLGAVLRGLAARGRLEEFDAECGRLIPASPESGAEGARLDALCHAATELIGSGRRARAIEAVRRIRALVEDGHVLDARLAGEAEHVGALHAAMVGDAEARVSCLERAVNHAERAGDARAVAAHLGALSLAVLELGDRARAEQVARRALACADEVHAGTAGARARFALGLVLSAMPHAHDEARQMLEEAHAELSLYEELRLAGWAEAGLAELDLARGELASAEVRARSAAAALENVPVVRPWALGLLAQSLLALGRSTEALEPARLAASMVLGDDGVLFREAYAPLALVDALRAAGDSAGARESLGSALARLRDRARSIESADVRARFMATPDAARTLTLHESTKS